MSLGMVVGGGIGLVAAVLLPLLGVAYLSYRRGRNIPILVLLAGPLALLLGAAAQMAFALTPVTRLQAALGRVQAGEALYKLPSTDSLRASFDQLHRVSVGLTGFAIVAAIVLIAMLVGRKDALYGNA